MEQRVFETYTEIWSLDLRCLFHRSFSGLTSTRCCLSGKFIVCLSFFAQKMVPCLFITEGVVTFDTPFYLLLHYYPECVSKLLSMSGRSCQVRWVLFLDSYTFTPHSHLSTRTRIVLSDSFQTKVQKINKRIERFHLF